MIRICCQEIRNIIIIVRRHHTTAVEDIAAWQEAERLCSSIDHNLDMLYTTYTRFYLLLEVCINVDPEDCANNVGSYGQSSYLALSRCISSLSTFQAEPLLSALIFVAETVLSKYEIWI